MIPCKTSSSFKIQSILDNYTILIIVLSKDLFNNKSNYRLLI